MNELKTVRLYGTLGAKFGRVHRLVIASPAEAC
ncbi:UNVERIFIED_ASMBLY: tail assembly protein, partial [Cronobacter sakazakii]